MTCVSLTQCGRFTATHSHGGTLNEAAHSHTFGYEATFYGPLNQEGYLIDFRDISRTFHTHINTRLEGQDLNTLFANPTTEALAIWIFNELKTLYPQLTSVKVSEAEDRWIVYQGETPCP